jgi:hypothetical protein
MTMIPKSLSVHMDSVIEKWDNEFSISDEEKEPLNFLLCQRYLNSFKDYTTGHITDEKHNIDIDKRAKAQTKELRKENSDLEEDKDELEENNSELTEEISELKQSLELSRQSDTHSRNLVTQLHGEAAKNIQKGQNIQKENDKDMMEMYKTQNSDLKTEKCELKGQLEAAHSTINKYMKHANKGSQAKGEEGEDLLGEGVNSDPEFLVDPTHTENHKGDYVIEYEGKRFCLDAKNWKSIVSYAEVKKLLDDIVKNGYDGGAIISYENLIINPITRKATQNLIQRIRWGGKPILLISHASRSTPEYINSVLKMLHEEEPSNKTPNEFKCLEKTLKYIQSEEKEIEKERNSIKTEKNSFNKRIKIRDQAVDMREILLNNLKNSISGEDLQSDSELEDEQTPSIEKPLTAKRMRELLAEVGENIDGFKGKGTIRLLRKKYQEVFLSP